ncbi:hypothetical protein QTO34_009921 [Cnephaeus nilssonii]|uniref:Uncharacterized protein n=1 Tax=Cnephaeus nilssonii TaxID=3371016 RepID=A0AA40HEN7_CNENI|nr:hypothetical protein QTO34_009921 [Eptesicus nilssonii]
MYSSTENGLGLQDEHQRANANLQRLQAQKQQGQGLLNGLDEQESQLQEQLREICTSEEELATLGKSGVAYSKEQQDWGRVWSQGRASWDLLRGTFMAHSRKSVQCKWMKRQGIERKELKTHSNQ